MLVLLHTKSFRVGCFLMILACGILQMRFALQEQQDFSEKIVGNGPVHTTDPQLLTFYAKQKHLLDADLSGANSLFQQALISNPYHIPAWLGLAELRNDQGNKQNAAAILGYVDTLTREIKRWRWEKALVAYQLGKNEMLPSELSYIVREISGKTRNDALQLAFTLWEIPEDLLRNMGRANVVHLFNFAVRKKLPQPALFFWRTIEDNGSGWTERELLAFIDMLLSTNELPVAADIWRKYINQQNILHNGDFTQPFLQQAFGWRSIKDKGFEQRFAKNSKDGRERLLHYRFKGWHNLDFSHLYQIVPIENGKKYQLTAELKSERMTTNQRPFLEVYGYKCSAPYVQSEMVAPEQDWQEYKIEFGIPADCSAVVVRLRRKTSNHIDNKLAGQLWLRNIAINATGEDYIILDTLPQ